MVFVIGEKEHPTFQRDGADLVYTLKVPLVDALALGVPEDVAHGEVWEFEGIFMVGGCRKPLSRKDAYGLHLRRKEGICFGDLHALYQRGNR